MSLIKEYKELLLGLKEGDPQTFNIEAQLQYTDEYVIRLDAQHWDLLVEYPITEIQSASGWTEQFRGAPQRTVLVEARWSREIERKTMRGVSRLIIEDKVFGDPMLTQVTMLNDGMCTYKFRVNSVTNL